MGGGSEQNELAVFQLKQERPDFFRNPERLPNEICLINSHQDEDIFEKIPFSSKRKGVVAIDMVDGKPLSSNLGYFPIFVDVNDFLTNKDKWRQIQSEVSALSEDDINQYLDKGPERN